MRPVLDAEQVGPAYVALSKRVPEWNRARGERKYAGSNPATLTIATSITEVMRISKLLFLSNELISPTKRDEMRLPLHFVTFAHIEAQMYTNVRNDGVINIIQERTWGNNVTYGAVFLLDDFDYHIRTLDAHHLCSLSSLRRNHVLDTQHRVELHATPISFDTIDDLERLLYEEREPVLVQAYIGNLNHPRIHRRIKSTRSERIIDNIMGAQFLELHREVHNGREGVRISERAT